MIRNFLCFCLVGGLSLSVAYAGDTFVNATRMIGTRPGTRASLSPNSFQFAAGSGSLSIRSPFSSPEEEHDSLEQLAADLSYFGAILLTAHEILASVRSWTGVLEFQGRDGSQIELTKTPKGMGVMVRLSLPLD